MGQQVQSTGWTGILKSFLKQRYFSQYVSGFIAMIFAGLIIFEMQKQESDKEWLAIYVAIIIIMLFVNVFLGRESMKNENVYSGVQTEKKRREDPSVIQQMQADLATLNNRLPSQEDLETFKVAVKNAEIAIDLQKDEAKLLLVRQELRETQEEIKSIEKELSNPKVE